MQATQSTQATQIGIRPNIVPVSPVDVSPAEMSDMPSVFCQECDTVWQSKEPSRCPCCARCVGTPFQDNLPIDFLELENAVKDMTYGVNDEDDLDGMYRIMEERCPWFRKYDAEQAKACWTFLYALPATEEIDHALDFFEFIMNTE